MVIILITMVVILITMVVILITMVVILITMVVSLITMVMRNITIIVSRYLGAGLGATLGVGKSVGNLGCKCLIISSGC